MIKIETFKTLSEECKKQNKTVYQICEEQENCENVREKVYNHILAMKNAINEGLNSSEKSLSGMTGFDCAKLKEYYAKNSFNGQEKLNNIMLYALATAEQNARMGKIAACPTAGACGIVPAVILACTQDKEQQINSLMTAGIIGKIISRKVALAGAVMGCQGECGVAAAMAAGAYVQIKGGSTDRIINAVALTLKNIMGLVCDPVAGLVEVPCVKRNVFMAMTAVTGAELALAGIESVISADEVVDAVKQTGMLMSPQLKESSQAGLAVTKTGLNIAERIKNEI